MGIQICQLHKFGSFFQITYALFNFTNNHKTKGSTPPREWDVFNKYINRVENDSSWRDIGR